MIKEKYPYLKTLLSCYFHQDMEFDYNNAEEALKDYVFKTGNEYINSALNEIQQLKNEKLNPKKLWTEIGNLGCEHRYDEYTPEEWLDYVSKIIKKNLIEKQKLEERESIEDNGQKYN